MRSRNNMEGRLAKKVVGDEARKREGVTLYRACGPGKDFSPFTLTEMLEGFEQRMTGSLWFLRRE